jgi:hypothetical protein
MDWVPVYVALDLAEAALLLAVAAFFVHIGRKTGDGLHFLLGVGFGLTAVGLATVTTSAFDLARPGQLWDGWALAGLVGLGLALYVVVPPPFALPSLARAFPVAHVAKLLAYAACFGLSLGSYRRSHAMEHALVPAAFLCWTAAMASWLALDLTGSPALLPAVYAARSAAVLLLVAAVAWPVRSARPEVARAAA